MSISVLADAIEHELRVRAVPERAEREQRYLKTDLVHLGTPMPAIRSIMKAHLKRRPLDHGDVIELATLLWEQPVYERRAAAAVLLESTTTLLDASDIAFLERLLRESRTWALVDSIAAWTVGPLVDRFPDLTAVLDRWAGDDDFWIRRSALLAHEVALREGRGDFERFARYADTMLSEREFFIRKAIGWVLRDMSRKRPDLVFEWFLPRAHLASGVTVREVVKHLPEDQREAILAAR